MTFTNFQYNVSFRRNHHQLYFFIWNVKKVHPVLDSISYYEFNDVWHSMVLHVFIQKKGFLRDSEHFDVVGVEIIAIKVKIIQPRIGTKIVTKNNFSRIVLKRKNCSYLEPPYTFLLRYEN